MKVPNAKWILIFYLLFLLLKLQQMQIFFIHSLNVEINIKIISTEGAHNPGELCKYGYDHQAKGE